MEIGSVCGLALMSARLRLRHITHSTRDFSGIEFLAFRCFESRFEVFSRYIQV